MVCGSVLDAYLKLSAEAPAALTSNAVPTKALRLNVWMLIIALPPMLVTLTASANEAERQAKVCADHMSVWLKDYLAALAVREGFLGG